MTWNRLIKALYILCSGGLVLQTTGCETVVGPAIANLLASVALNFLLGGLTT